jgi:hypothetical protein
MMQSVTKIVQRKVQIATDKYLVSIVATHAGKWVTILSGMACDSGVAHNFSLSKNAFRMEKMPMP